MSLLERLVRPLLPRVNVDENDPFGLVGKLGSWRMAEDELCDAPSLGAKTRALEALCDCVSAAQQAHAFTTNLHKTAVEAHLKTRTAAAASKLEKAANAVRATGRCLETAEGHLTQRVVGEA